VTTCRDARDDLSALLDEAMAPAARAALEAHLAACPDCRRELEALRATAALLRRLGPARAPAGFVDRVVAAAYPRSWRRRLRDFLFVPLRVKLPLEVAAVGLVAVLAVTVYRQAPEIRQRAGEDLAARAPGAVPPASEPAPAGPPRGPGEPTTAPRGARGRAAGAPEGAPEGPASSAAAPAPAPAPAPARPASPEAGETTALEDARQHAAGAPDGAGPEGGPARREAPPAPAPARRAPPEAHTAGPPARPAPVGPPGAAPAPPSLARPSTPAPPPVPAIPGPPASAAGAADRGGAAPEPPVREREAARLGRAPSEPSGAASPGGGAPPRPDGAPVPLEAPRAPAPPAGGAPRSEALPQAKARGSGAPGPVPGEAPAASAPAAPAPREAARLTRAVDASGRLVVAERARAERAVDALLPRVEAIRVARWVEGDGPLLLDVVVPRARYRELAAGLAAIGQWRLEYEATPLPDRVRVEIAIGADR
jgi:hypothetical protein